MQCCSNSPGPDYWDFPIKDAISFRAHGWLAEHDASRHFPPELMDWLNFHDFTYNGRFIHKSSDLSQYGEMVYTWKIMIRLYDPKAAMLYKLTWI